MRGQESDHIRFDPGTYYIGDPCYAIPDAEWMDYLNSYGPDWGGGEATTFKGHKVWHDSTAFGDGSYRGSDGFEYGVDAGIIGIIPVALICEQEFGEIETCELGRIVTFDKPFYVYCEKDSTFNFGDITIVTDGSQEEEEEEDEQYYCTSCLNEVDYDGDTCDDCLAEEEDEE